MLSKLFKHEFKYYIRIYSAVYIIIAVTAVLTKFLPTLVEGVSEESETLFHVVIIFFISLLIGGITFILFGASVISYFVGIKRFNKSMFSSEGYLTNTLPVTSASLIAVKLTTTVIFYIITRIVCSFVWQIVLLDDFDFSTLLLEFGTSSYDSSMAEIITDFLSGILTYSAFILMSYMCLAMQSSFRMSKFVTILCAIGLLFANVIALAIILGIVSGVTDTDILRDDFALTENIVSIVYYTVICTGLFFITNLLVSKKLNLE